jgi:hypothetical protein
MRPALALPGKGKQGCNSNEKVIKPVSIIELLPTGRRMPFLKLSPTDGFREDVYLIGCVHQKRTNLIKIGVARDVRRISLAIVQPFAAACVSAGPPGHDFSSI